MRIERAEFAQLLGRTVKVCLKEKDGTFKVHWHRYKTPEKANYMYQVKWKSVNGDNNTKVWEKVDKDIQKSITWEWTEKSPYEVFVDNVLGESNEKIKQLCFELAKETTYQVMEATHKYLNGTMTDNDHILERIFDKVWVKKIKELEKENNPSK